MNKIFSKVILANIIIIILFSTVSVSAMNIKSKDTDIKNDNYSSLNNNAPYEGELIVYIVEPVSRWLMINLEPYHYSVLDIVYSESISIDYQDTFDVEIEWRKVAIDRDNIMVMAVVYNSYSEQRYSKPPSLGPFDANFVDAAACATPDSDGYNTVTDDFTHTVFLEVGTASYCTYCLDTANALSNIYDSGDYPFYYVSLVSNLHEQSRDRLSNHYNLYGFPTTFCDGGYEIVYGGKVEEHYYRSAIESCGSRDVHQLGLGLSVDYKDYTAYRKLEINVNIENNDQIERPEKPQTPSGPSTCKPNKEGFFTTSTSDPNGDQVYYMWDWGDGTTQVWRGPYPSGQSITTGHTWTSEDSYEVKVRAKDINENEGVWSDPFTLKISTCKPKIPGMSQIMESIFDLFPNLFPFLRLILE